MTHSAIYRVGEFDFDTTRYPRGKWGFSTKSSGSGPHHGGVPTSGANSIPTDSTTEIHTIPTELQQLDDDFSGSAGGEGERSEDDD